MFQNMQVTSQPIFYLFIAASILLSLGYAWGKRRNTRIHLSTFNVIIDFLKPKDQSFTTIGGLTGYHANIIPKKNKVIRRVDLTLTLLPRQSLLYLPFSLLITKSDRLYTTMLFGKKVKPPFGEGHLVEKKFSKTKSGAIDNTESFSAETIQWGGREFILYSKGRDVHTAFSELVKTLKDPVSIKHIAFIPGEGKAYFFMVPKYGTVEPVFGPLYDWVVKTAGLSVPKPQK